MTSEQIDLLRSSTMTAEHCLQTAWAYFKSAQAGRRKYGRRYDYRPIWLRAALVYRRFARTKRSQSGTA